MTAAARASLDRAAARYRRTYDRLYVASQKAGSAEECERIDAALAAANAAYAAAKATAQAESKAVAVAANDRRQA